MAESPAHTQEGQANQVNIMARTPFFGRGPGPQIARMDMQAATAPGRAWGDALEVVGREGAEAIETYSKNKQRSEMLDGQIGAILRNMTPEQQAQLDSNPIGKTLKKFVNQDLSLSGKESLLGSLAIDMQMYAQQREQDRVGRLDQLEVDKFNETKRRNELTEGLNLDKWLQLQGDSDAEKTSAAGMSSPKNEITRRRILKPGRALNIKAMTYLNPRQGNRSEIRQWWNPSPTLGSLGGGT